MKGVSCSCVLLIHQLSYQGSSYLTYSRFFVVAEKVLLVWLIWFSRTRLCAPRVSYYHWHLFRLHHPAHYLLDDARDCVRKFAGAFKLGQDRFNGVAVWIGYRLYEKVILSYSVVREGNLIYLVVLRYISIHIVPSVPQC